LQAKEQKLDETVVTNTPFYKALESKYLITVEENMTMKEEIEKYKKDLMESTNQRRHDKENVSKLRESQKKTYTNKIEAVEVKLRQLSTEKEQLILEIEKMKAIAPLRPILDRKDEDISNLEKKSTIRKRRKEND